MIKINIIDKIFNRTSNIKNSNDSNPSSKPNQNDFRKKLSEKQLASKELMDDLKVEYEKASKLASGNPVLDECIQFYNDNFDSNERAIGISFTKYKVIPKAVPLIRQAINDLVLEQKIDLEDLKKEENKYLRKLLLSKDKSGQTLFRRVLNTTFDGKYPLPYREVPSRYHDENDDVKQLDINNLNYIALTKDLIKRVLHGEIEYVDQVCKYTGIQFAILEILTKRFDEKTLIKKGLPVSYDIEFELLDENSKGEKIKISTKKGNVYKEEIALLILQIKYQLMRQSGKYDNENDAFKNIKSKMRTFYKKHYSRTKKADKIYFDKIKAELSEEKDKLDSRKYLVDQLQEEKSKVKERIQNREDLDNNSLERIKIDAIARKRFIKIPGLVDSYDDATPLESLAILQAYNEQKKSIDISIMPEKNRLYVNTIIDDSQKYSGFKEGEKVEEKTRENTGENTNFNITVR